MDGRALTGGQDRADGKRLGDVKPTARMNGATEVWRVSAVVAPAASAGVWAAREPGRGFKVCGSGSAPRPPTASLPPPPQYKTGGLCSEEGEQEDPGLGTPGPS